MTRFDYPESDRWYLPFFDSIEYHIDSIKKGLMLDSENRNPDGFRMVYRHAEYLLHTIRLGAIQQERHSNPLFTAEFPND